MYQEASVTWKYNPYAGGRALKRRLYQQIISALVLLCISCTVVFGVDRLLTVGAFAFSKSVAVEQEKEITAYVPAPLSVSALMAAVKEAEPEPEPVMVRTTPLIYVDAGHGGEDQGCAREGVLEKDINLAIALLVREQLEELGYEVMMSRETDVYSTKEARVIEANEAQADIYVSIHQNATEEENDSVSGMEVWYEGTDAERDNKRLAQLVSQQTVKSTGAVERELRGDADFHVTGSTTMPACLIETGFLSNAGERAQLTDEAYQRQIASGIVQGIDYYFHPKTMYLTFDDGPSKENTERILDILQERNIKATFFLVGENVRRYPEIAQRIVAEGHTVGIHCDCHDYETLYESVDSYIEDFEKARQTVYEVTGVEAKLFRFPGGSVNAYNQKVGADIIAEMTARGYIYYDWNASVEDAVKNPVPEQLVKNGVETTLGRKKVVMLAHDRVQSTAQCLEELLDKLPEYEMLALDEDVEPVCF